MGDQINNLGKRVLLVHNFYQSHAPSGEDGVFLEDEKLLLAKGHHIIRFIRKSDALKHFSPLKNISLTWNISWSISAYKDIEETIRETRPDIAHVYNTFPLISPSIYFACRKHNIPVVQTVQNYRILCAAGVLFKNDEVCELCIKNSKFNAIRYGCYRNSKIQTVPVVCMQWVHHAMGTWAKYVDMFVAATEFSRRKLIQGGLPSERVMVKPNFFISMPKASYENDNYAVFLGRLSVEKGVRTLLNAWKQLPDIPLKIIGNGILRKEVEKASACQKNIEFLGHLSHDECLTWLQRAKFLVMPSEWYEGFPMTIREAFACGKPVIGSRMGAMAEIISDGKTGRLFTPGSSEDLAKKVKWLASNEKAAQEMGRVARIEFENKYSSEKNYEILIDIYKSVLTTEKNK